MHSNKKILCDAQIQKNLKKLIFTTIEDLTKKNIIIEKVFGKSLKKTIKLKALQLNISVERYD
jgi:hypothetical protein